MTIVTNPNLAFQSVSDPSTWLDADNRFVGPLYYQRTIPFQASAAVALGDIVQFVAPTSTVPLTVKPSTTTASESVRGIGVARAAAASGDIVDVIVEGVAVVNVGTADPVFGDLATFQANTTAGVATVLAQASYAAQTTLVAKFAGVFLSADDTPSLGGVAQTTQAVLWVGRCY